MQSYIRLAFVLAVGPALFLGCGPAQPSAAKYNDTNLKRLVNCYSMFQYGHGFKGPKSEEEFKEFLKNDKGAGIKLKRIGVDQSKIDDIFINERDGQPFKVRYGLNGADINHAIVFESVGVDGQRLVGLNPAVECDNALYDEYWEGKKVDQETEEVDETQQ